MTPDELLKLVEVGGMPGAVAVALYFAMRGRHAAGGDDDGISRADVVEKITSRLDALSREVTDRLARVETEVQNLKGRDR